MHRVEQAIRAATEAVAAADYKPSRFVVHPDSMRWARDPQWPAPSAEAVLAALYVGTVDWEQVRAQGWSL